MSKESIFTHVAVKIPKRSKFDLSHDVKFSTDPGVLTPCMVMDCVPGDYVNLKAQALVRFSPLITPLMHRVNVAIHYFFVPNRILWDNWEHFITKTPDDVTSEPPVFPYLSFNPSIPGDVNYLAASNLLDYLGVPQTVNTDPGELKISALVPAAYQRIYYDYYKWKGDMEGDVTPSPTIGTKVTDGSNNINKDAFCTFRRRGWNHDYFTSALTASQKGSIVDIPLGDIVFNPQWFTDDQNPVWRDINGQLPQNTDVVGADLEATQVAINADGTNWNQGNLTSLQRYPPMAAATELPLAYDPDGSLTVAPVTINELRRAESLQTFLELLARGGSRYTELVKNFFNTNTGDSRVQRSEYITGIVTPVQISEVLNTTGIDGELPQGNMAGHGAAVINGNAGGYHCREHGYIIGLISVLPDTAYQQGLPRHFSKFDPEDYFFPQFEGLGEQEIKNRELYASFDTSVDDDVFGYIPRYSEYKYIPNRVAGLFKTTLKHWHWGRIFSETPNLSQTFINCFPRSDVYAVTSGSQNKLYCHVNNRILASRPMRKFTIPTL